MVGESIHGEAHGACQRTGKSGRDDEEASFFAQPELTTGGLISLFHRLTDDVDEAGADTLGFVTDSLLRCRDKWRNKHSAVGAGVNPLLTVEPARFRRVFAVDNYLFLERAVEEQEVTVGVICAFADTQGVDAPEKFGMLAPNRQPTRIFADVSVYSVERPGGAKNAIIKILFKNRQRLSAKLSLILMDSHFQHAYIGSEMTAERGGYKNQQVDMIRHYAILKNPQGTVEGAHSPDIFLYDCSQPAAHNDRIREMTAQMAEGRNFPGFTEGYVINAPSFVIM